MNDKQKDVVDKTQYLFGSFEIDFKKILFHKQVILLIDENVFIHHENKFSDYFKIIIPSGEKFKNQNTVNQIYQELIAFEADRSTMIVGVGGGVTTDIAGYVATTYMRGVDFGFVPSTLLAQVDASIGGKNGIDIGLYKNIIGTIKQPNFVFFDINLLQSLPKTEWINGCAEMIKHACIKDENLFTLLQKHTLKRLQNDNIFLQNIIKQNVDIKKAVIENDPYEKGERKLLNFGHTIGHAIENKYQLMHGQAVSIGIVVASKLSVMWQDFDKGELQKIINLLEQYQLPIDYPYKLDDIFDILKMDKKREREHLHFILLKKIGVANIEKISIETLYKTLQQMDNK